MKNLIRWLQHEIARIKEENEENDYRVYWLGNDIDGADALRILRHVLLKAEKEGQ
jgi:hypothetical protein